MPPIRIVVVDDHYVVREGLRSLIERQADFVFAGQATNGAEAIERAQHNSPDLVLTDLRMPGMDGTELVKRLKESNPDLPSVMITAQGTIESAVNAMKNGASDFLLKPCTPDALEVVIGRIERTTRLIRENQYLREEALSTGPTTVIAKSPSMVETLRTAARVSRSKGTVLARFSSDGGVVAGSAQRHLANGDGRVCK